MDYTNVSHYPTVVPEIELDKLRKLIIKLEGDLAKINISYAGGHISLKEYSDKRKKMFTLAKRMQNVLNTKVKGTLVYTNK